MPNRPDEERMREVLAAEYAKWDAPSGKGTRFDAALRAMSTYAAECVAKERERAGGILAAAIEKGYAAPVDAICEHGRPSFEDCIACYDEKLNEALAAIRSLPNGQSGEGK